ncbi:MAG TPA: methyltransferase domain-containing protein [Candidatus Saccharimonadales bacterium]|nr:methyltransferase domain-containing protein [Candidatus Saccharimonadales bacterium]
MQTIDYSKFDEEAQQYWEWAQNTPIEPVPESVAREGAGAEMRTPIMHYGVIAPVYMSVIRYLRAIKPKKGMRLIELGSGSGRPLTYLKTQFPDLEVWGVDYSAGGIAYAQKTYGKYGVKFKHVPAQDTSLKDGYFDFVISSHVIEHVTEPEALNFMQEAHRLLKKGGYAFIGTPERRHCQELYSLNPTDEPKLRLVPPHEHEFRMSELKALGQQVFPKNNVRVDALINPTFMKAFGSSIDKFKPSTPLRKHTVSLAYRTLRDKAPRPLFDTITRIGAKRQMNKFGISFQDMLFDNRIEPESKTIPDNLFLVCQK